MRKKNYLLVLAMILGMAATGCATSPSSTQAPETTVETEDTTEAVTEADTTEASEEDTTEDTTEEVSLVPVVEIQEFEYETENADLIVGSYDKATITNSGYEALQTSVDAWFANYEGNYMVSIASMADQAKELKLDHELAFYYRMNADTTRNDNRIVSMSIGEDFYRGGIHSSYYEYGITFDVETGEELTIEALGDIQEDLKAKALELLAEHEFVDNFVESYQENVTMLIMDGGIDWYLTDLGVQMVFNEYMVAPYTYGAIRVTVAYEDLPGFNEAYLPE